MFDPNKPDVSSPVVEVMTATTGSVAARAGVVIAASKLKQWHEEDAQLQPDEEQMLLLVALADINAPADTTQVNPDGPNATDTDLPPVRDAGLTPD